MARRVKSLRMNCKGISPNHRQHGSVVEKDHKRKVRIRRQIAEILEEIEARENRYERIWN